MRHELHTAWFHLRRHVRAWLALIGIPLAINAVLLAVAVAMQVWAGSISVPPSITTGGAAGTGSTGSAPTWLTFAIRGEAEAVLATIASIMATTTVLLYSALLVVQQLTASQFSPRLVSGIPRDRGVQAGAGLALGTVTYSLVTLAALRSDAGIDQTPAVLVAMALAALAIFAFILTLLHISGMIQVNSIIDRVADEAADAIVNRMHRDRPAEAADPPVARGREPLCVGATCSGYLQTVDYDGLRDLALAEGIAVQVMPPIGEFVTRGVPLFEVFADGAVDPHMDEKLVDALAIGPTPLVVQDPEYGLRLLVDIALRALSPAINDPSTAVTCIDHLEHLLLMAARLFDEDEVERQHEGCWVVKHRPITFARLLDRACRQLRHYGARDYAVQIRLQRLLLEVAERTDAADRLAAIEGHALGLAASLERCDWPEHDRVVPRQRHQAIMAALARGRATGSVG